MAEYENNCFILHGAVVWSEGLNDLRQLDDGYVICDEGLCAGVYEEIPEAYRDFPVEDHWDGIIIPGLVDLHVHAAQYNNRSLGMDMELIEWLDKLTFPEEARFAQDRDYAVMSYDAFAEDLFIGATTRAVVFATADYLTTLKLMDALEDRGLVTYVGKVNMDRNVPAAQGAVDAFIAMREREGSRLKEDVESRLATVRQAVDRVEAESPKTVAAYRARLEEKMRELLESATVDEQRLITETAIFADRVAVDEETVRLKSHCDQIESLLAGDEPVGRKLDFLMQEANREINTIGSKCQNTEIANIVVTVKAELEKIREQIQNLE